MRIAIAQLRVHWTLADNLAGLLPALAQASAAGAQLCVCGELALPGYHRQIAQEADPARIVQALQAVAQACRQHRVACAVGAPAWPADGGRPFNSHHLFNDSGELLARTDKDGLTFVETLFFQPGQGRPVVPLHGLRCATVLCREVEEAALLHEQLPPGSIDLVLWPSLALSGALAPPPGLEPLAADLARHSGAHWVQCNAPNAPNTPGDPGLGGSVVIAPDGQVLLRLPCDEPGLAVFDLGATSFTWLPQNEAELACR